VINPAASGVRAGAEQQLTARLAEHGYSPRVFVIGKGDAERKVTDAVASGPDLLLVLAGDGTARLAAEHCGPEGPLLAPLPGGTMNMLPHALYGEVGWPAALAAMLDHGVERAVGGGRVEGHAFFVAALLGSAALWGNAREALRAGRLVEAKRRADLALSRILRGRIAYAAEGGPERKVRDLALICPLVSKAMKEETGLEMVAFDFHDAGEVARLALSGFTGDWRDDPSVSTQMVQRGWARQRGSLLAMVDGETVRLPRQATFEFVPRAFRALAPPRAPAAIL
jgi:diacylglycerol kinase family enzyme